MIRRTLLFLAPLVLTACAASAVPDLPNPKTGQTLAPTTTAPDFSQISLPIAAGRTTTTGFPGEGKATIAGTMTGPSGAVKQATVYVQRLDGGAATVTTNDEGKWSLGNLLGGRYRVRAWKAPNLSSTDAQIFFLSLEGSKTVNVQLSEYEGENATFAIAPDPPVLYQEANLAIQITTQGVSGSGVVQAVGVVGVTVTIAVAGQFTLVSSSSAVTDSSGQATFRVRCIDFASSPVSFFVQGAAPLTHEFARCSAPVTTIAKTTTTSK